MKKVLGKVSLFTLVLAGSFVAGQTASADSYTIQHGDSFYSIAQNHGIDAYELAAANGLGIYDLIVPGQVLTLPGTAAVSYAEPVATPTEAPAEAPAESPATSDYTVQNGDSISSIAAAFGMDYNQLASDNGLSAYDYIVPGQVLRVASTTAAAPTDTSSSSYYLSGYDYEPGINYPVGQCTWAVQKLTGWAGDWWGNASSWVANAAKDGYSVGTTPAVGSIIVWSNSGFGHVAYVTAVESDTKIQVMEANVGGKQWIDNHRGWFNPDDGYSQISYIYPH